MAGKILRWSGLSKKETGVKQWWEQGFVNKWWCGIKAMSFQQTLELEMGTADRWLLKLLFWELIKEQIPLSLTMTHTLMFHKSYVIFRNYSSIRTWLKLWLICIYFTFHFRNVCSISLEKPLEEITFCNAIFSCLRCKCSFVSPHISHLCITWHW